MSQLSYSMIGHDFDPYSDFNVPHGLLNVFTAKSTPNPFFSPEKESCNNGSKKAWTTVARLCRGATPLISLYDSLFAKYIPRKFSNIICFLYKE
jgi:hypothetical protein